VNRRSELKLARIFALAVGGFSVMNNHLHLLLRLDPRIAESWSDEGVVRRWGRLFPPRDGDLVAGSAGEDPPFVEGRPPKASQAVGVSRSKPFLDA
jgi:hypothetical protein